MPDIHLKPHRLKIALLQPQIAPNTGNIARLCVATGTPLHLVRPMGFNLSDKNVRRSAMDYWEKVQLTVHDDDEAFFRFVSARADGDAARFWLFSTKGTIGLWEAAFADGDWLIFGSETSGISDALLAANEPRTVRIPQVEGERCLNLSTAAGIGLFEAMRSVVRG
jgi:tRNA (cytidine/uridine-2'-O-)-methyltransferase